MDTVLIWNAAETVSAVILLAALILMVKFYREYLDIDIQEMQDWKLVIIGLAFYIGLKTHFTLFANAFGKGVAALPWQLVGLFGMGLILASSFVFLGFYGLVKDYL